MKIMEIQGRYFITIPKEKAQRWGFEKGMEVNWDFNERGNLELTKIDTPLARKNKTTIKNRTTNTNRKGDYLQFIYRPRQ